MKLRYLILSASLALMISTTDETYAQTDPRQILANVINQLQTGTPNPQFYGQLLWYTIAQQTNNSGVYPALSQLGSVTDIQVNQQQQMPGGILFSMTAKHQNGGSSWNLGISQVTNRIEYANFSVSAQSMPLPDPGSGGSTPAPTQPADKSSPACQKFPNLC